MEKEAPDKLLLQWLDAIPIWQREALALHYVFMTSSDSGDFSLTGVEAWQKFNFLLIQPEFPLRRVSQLLTIRSIFTFLLEFSDSNTFPLPPSVVGDAKSYPFDGVQFLRICKHWRELCQAGLSDIALRDWLADLQC